MRNLNADEIDCRVQSINDKGCTLFLYKDARCDMRILDETYGEANWQREHYECKGNLFCRVGVKIKEEWVWKSDCGTESNTEKQKGEASDSFKRACVNWGIGRELYTAPFIWIALKSDEIKKENNRTSLDRKVSFKVSLIEYNDTDEITQLIITDQNNEERYRLKGAKQKTTVTPDPNLQLAIQEMKESKNLDELRAVWSRWKAFQNNEVFTCEKDKRKQQLTTT